MIDYLGVAVGEEEERRYQGDDHRELAGSHWCGASGLWTGWRFLESCGEAGASSSCVVNWRRRKLARVK